MDRQAKAEAIIDPAERCATTTDSSKMSGH